MNNHLQPIPPDHQLDIEQRLQPLVRNEPGYTAIRKVADWIAVPRPSADHFDENLLEQFLTVLHRDRHHSLFVILLEEGTGLPMMASYQATREELLALNDAYGFFVCLLTPPTFDWLVLCTKADYTLFIGKPQDVVALTGESRIESQHTFANFIDSIQRITWLAEDLRAVATQADNYHHAESETWIEFTW